MARYRCKQGHFFSVAEPGRFPVVCPQCRTTITEQCAGPANERVWRTKRVVLKSLDRRRR